LRRAARLAGALVLAALLVWLDAATKQWATTELARRGGRALIDGYLTLRVQQNSGIAFGILQPHLLPGKARMLVTYKAAMAGALLLLLAWRCLRARPEWLAPVGLVALLAGTMGNLIDRARKGSVTDFIAVNLGGWRWPAFNLADLFLAAGLGLCLAALIAGLRGREATA
jgi:signal peptidase II